METVKIDLEKLPKDVVNYLLELVKRGELDPNCRTCQAYFYPAIGEGKKISDVFAPRHKASDRCESGKYAHCSCDTCF